MLDDNHLIVLGDFNTVLDPALDRLKVSRPRPDPAARLLSSLVTGYSLCDVYRCLCPNERASTWRRHSNHSTQMCRLDLILVSDDLASSAVSVWLRPWQWSDHLLLSASFRVQEVRLRGPGYWHLNLAVLGDGDYSDSVEEFWKSRSEEKPRFSSLSDCWDVGKCHVRDLTRQYCTDWARRRRVRRMLLNDTLTRYNDSLSATSVADNASLRAAIRETEAELRQMDINDMTGARVRSRIGWHGRGESSAGFFVRMERQRQKDSPSPRSVTMGGVVLPSVTCSKPALPSTSVSTKPLLLLQIVLIDSCLPR